MSTSTEPAAKKQKTYKAKLLKGAEVAKEIREQLKKEVWVRLLGWERRDRLRKIVHRMHERLGNHGRAPHPSPSLYPHRNHYPSTQVEELKASHKITPGLVTILIGANPASQSYVRSKNKTAGDLGFPHIS